ncbi:hypothetical protein OG887_41860 (plasmid) [Streptomyces sp. NBC_00053]|uniref:hypothetical protein n=1 Tax=unclassified Streptomyces TaxID=2593676 RepID=UPI00224D0CE5|nr:MULTISPECIES: hypothetical protein [unclassified Streptomyces]MCX4399673.1 hypothetical protein [Streptomyces sp. NBC_01767]MCX5505787.1 hypothetical protein [Streptomyces sp. NBC_00052]MCX5553750.1 hypothetical protein [Streptomyces sp. NBC_00051]
MKRASFGRRIATAAATLGMLGAAVIGGAGSASAGSNGQQIRFHDGKGTVTSLYIVGYNHDGQSVGHCFSTPNVDNYFSGWWWKGNINVYIHTDNESCSGSPYGLLSYYSVPAYQADSDWYTIDSLRW